VGTAHPDQVGAAIRDTWWSPTACDTPDSLGTCALSPPMQTQTADVTCR
jgi:hypothetical protein